MQEQGIKERETQVKERNATSEENRVMTEQDRVIFESRRVDQAQQTVNDSLNKTALEYKKFHLDLMKSITEPIEKEKFEVLQNNLQKGLEDYKDAIASKADERKSKLLITQQSTLETQRQAGDIATQVMIQAGQNQRNAEDNARMASEGALNRARMASEGALNRENAVELKKMDGGTESNDPKIKNFISIQRANQGFFGTVLTSPNKIVDDLTAKYMTDRSQAEMDAWNDLTPEQQKGLTAPTPVTMSKQAKGGWLWGKVGAKPTQMLVGSDAINFKQFTTQGAKNSLKSTYPDKKEALDYLIGRGVSETAAKSIIDEVYK
jgi:hypothetical protein